MPTNKDFKRLVRGRMRKTGEAYTTARANLLKQPRLPRPSRAEAPVVTMPTAPAPAEYARLAGMSDEAIKAKTGCTWVRWVTALDYAKAHTWPHRKIAEYVHEKYKVGDWWSQTVTVGYERIKGLRTIGQRRDGSFEATKSRTFPVPASRLYQAFSDPRRRAEWLDGVELTVGIARRDKSLRLTWSDGSSVDVRFTGKAATKSQVAIQHRKLPDQASSRKMKEFWADRLDALAETLGAEGRVA